MGPLLTAAAPGIGCTMSLQNRAAEGEQGWASVEGEVCCAPKGCGWGSSWQSKPR